MTNSYQVCYARVEAFYQKMTKEELIKRLMWEHSVDDIMRMGTPKEEQP